jgi:hypothetical protein
MTAATHELSRRQQEYKQTLLDVRLRCGIRCILTQSVEYEDEMRLSFRFYDGERVHTCYTLLFPGIVASNDSTPYALVETAVSLIKLRSACPVLFATIYVPNGRDLLLKQYLTTRLALASMVPDDIWHVVRPVLFALLVGLVVSEYRLLLLTMGYIDRAHWNNYVSARVGHSVDFFSAISLSEWKGQRTTTHATHYSQTGLVIGNECTYTRRVTVTLSEAGTPDELESVLVTQIGVDILSADAFSFYVDNL